MSHRYPSILAIIVTAGCSARAGVQAPPLMQPGAPGEPGRAISAAKAVDLPAAHPTPADVRFMQGMIGHHAQALEMTDLVAARSTREEMKLLARRIALSQADEIEMMREWLALRGEQVLDAHAHHDSPMPGMLTAAEMDRLAAANGPAFDRLFLELMIKHHDGALVMVDELLAQPGAGRDEELRAFASDVDVDQRSEIARLAALLKEISP